MGNCSACMPRQLVHSPDNEVEFTAVHDLQTCAAHLCCLESWPAEPRPHGFNPSFSKPSSLLQPEAYPDDPSSPPQSPTTHIPIDCKPVNNLTLSSLQREASPYYQSAPRQSPTTHNPIAEKLRVAQQPQLDHSSAVAHEAIAAQLAPKACNNEFVLHSRQRLEAHEEGPMHNNPPSLQTEAVPCDLLKKETNGLLRMKVIISKKQLSEIMSSSCLPGDQAQDAHLVMKKMVASLLPHLPTSGKLNSIKCHQSWRPSLDKIPEGQPT